MQGQATFSTNFNHQNQQKEAHPLFSVIIPIYNTEYFLTTCLLSVKNQTFSNFECLLINDGSLGITPTSLKQKFFQNEVDQFLSQFEGIEPSQQAQTIFERVVADDKRFKFFTKKNGGLSDARNFGLEKARGKYIVFVDSDDWLESNHLQRYFDQIQSLKPTDPFTIFNFPASHYHNGKKIPQFIPKKYTLASLIHRNTFLAWAVLFEREIIEQANIKFDTRLGRGSNPTTRISDIAEDEFFALQYLEIVQKKHPNFVVKLLPHSTYNYREVDKNQKNDEQNRTYLNYAKLVKSYFKNKKLGWQVWLVSSLFPYWISLRFAKNPIILTWRKVINVFLRLVTNCY
jgi:glycosyltransferase involved in cell wall biosynthesis